MQTQQNQRVDTQRGTTLTESIFSYEGFQIRTAGTADNPLFNASDVCRVLGFKNPWDAVNNHVYEDDLETNEVIDSVGRKQRMNYVSESGLYALIFGSRLPRAKQFKRWVTQDVLPSIRKAGHYVAEVQPVVYKGVETTYPLEMLKMQSVHIALQDKYIRSLERISELQELQYQQSRIAYSRGKRWTEQETLKLIELRAEGYSWEEIADTLERSVSGIKRKYSRLEGNL